MQSDRYTTRQVAKLVGLPESRIRAYVRAGAVGKAPLAARARRAAPTPNAGTRPRLCFDFHDLLLLRSAGRLIKSGCAPRRVARALVAVRHQVACDAQLQGAALTLEAGRLVARVGERAWEPESGQCVLRFAARGVGQAVVAPLPSPAASQPSSTAAALHDQGGAERADAYFDRALRCEQDDPQMAYELYLRALACDPEHVEAAINVGRLCSAGGDLLRAAAYFRQATRCDAGHPVANFNLGVTLHDLGELSAAVEAYRAALICDPHFADAHYNLATVLDERGDKDEAERHFGAYRRICPDPHMQDPP